MRPYSRGYAKAGYLVNDSPVLRRPRRVHLEKAPDHTTPIRWAKPAGPEAPR